jgi:hypothetical protein
MNGTKERLSVIIQWLEQGLGQQTTSPDYGLGGRGFQHLRGVVGLAIAVVLLWFSLGGQPVALAGLNDDNYDGNIFALYAGNGSLVPPRVTLAQALKYGKPSLVVIYVDDSSDCKKFASVISQLQAPYGRVANFIPIMADAIPVKASYEPNEAGYYFRNAVPQTLIFDAEGTLVFNQTGTVSYEAIDDVMRQVFDLLPRTESVELRRSPVNEVNTELVPAGQ